MIVFKTQLHISSVMLFFIYSPLERVPVSEVTLSHLIAYDPERDLLPLILAHCNYSLEVGQETLVHYDWAALERQLIDRLLRGRPFVEFKVGWKYLLHIAHDEKKLFSVFFSRTRFHLAGFVLFILLLSLLHLAANSFNLILWTTRFS